MDTPAVDFLPRKCDLRPRSVYASHVGCLRSKVPIWKWGGRATGQEEGLRRRGKEKEEGRGKGDQSIPTRFPFRTAKNPVLPQKADQ